MSECFRQDERAAESQHGCYSRFFGVSYVSNLDSLKALNRRSFVCWLGLFILILCAFSLCVGCSADNGDSSEINSLVAATINGEDITEGDVSEYIDLMRGALQITNDDEWADYLDSLGMTAEMMRLNVIYELADQLLVRQAAADAGIEVSEEEVEAQLQEVRAAWGLSDDDDWEEELVSSGQTNDAYLERIEYQFLSQRLYEVMIPEIEPTEAEIQEYATTYIEAYCAKRSSVIVIAAEDYDRGIALYETIERAEDTATAFADGVTSAISCDDDTKNKGGDMGWSCLTVLSDTYQECLDGLSVGELSNGLVSLSTSYYAIIWCTDEYDGDLDSSGNADLSLMPSEIYEQLVADTGDFLYSVACDEYLTELRNDASIVINDMPDGLEYAL